MSALDAIYARQSVNKADSLSIQGQIDLCEDGIRLTGQVWIGNQTLEEYVAAIAREVTLAILAGG